ncbi:hypothetical protein SBV1_2390001 [Verrucomicrobia bacterium]|nr:hypothetical protein SBV1_2390001 [Verrucomicrobiota bacterium]
MSASAVRELARLVPPERADEDENWRVPKGLAALSGTVGSRKRRQAAHLYPKKRLLDITLALAPESERRASSPRPSPPEEAREKGRGSE